MADGPTPQIQFRSPTFDVEASGGIPDKRQQDDPSRSGHQSVRFREKRPKALQIQQRSSQGTIPGQDIYLGSYAQSTPRGSIDLRLLHSRSAPSPRESVSHLQIEHLLRDVDNSLNDYGVEELRDGFFGALFSRPVGVKSMHDMKRPPANLPASFYKIHPLSIRRFIPQQIKEVKELVRQVTASRAGVKLLKTFLGFFICYIICLIPASRDWLGRYSYIIAVSAIVNHPGRKVGSQIDGAVLTILGTIAGLSWGSLALYVSTSTTTARNGYGGVLAAFLIVFTLVIGWLRCVLIRFYQAVLCAGFAIFYMCLADTSEVVGWFKVFEYGIPFVLGQAVCIIVALLVFPDTGSRSLAQSIHRSLKTVNVGLRLPHQRSSTLKRDMASHFVDLSTAVRDFILEVEISRFHSDEATTLRNLLQAVLRSLLSLEPETTLFDNESEVMEAQRPLEDVDRYAAGLIRRTLAGPTRDLIEAMRIAIEDADKVILYLGGQKAKPTSIAASLGQLQASKRNFDAADLALLSRPDLSASYAKQPECVGLLLFVHPVRQTADKVEAFIQKVFEMQQRNRGWRIRLPTYPWRKAFTRSNAQVRHDRGGVTAGIFFQSQRQLQRTIADLQSTAYVPGTRQEFADGKLHPHNVHKTHEGGEDLPNSDSVHNPPKSGFRHRVWEILHRLQGFESRFAFKVTLVTTLISIPAWLVQSRDWWNTNESWWAVVMVWTMMHPRVGGTFQDLMIRILCAVLGAVWAAFACAAANGDPYIIGVFAAVYMIPMLHRFTQSSHPRSGIVGCLSFTVISLIAYNHQQTLVTIAWTRGLAFVVGVIAAVVVNWVLWPFIARHELRKSLATMLLHSAILYRGVVAEYIYYKDGQEPGPSDVVRSEMLEGRLREGFVRIQQLLELTRHEMRLRAPFDPLPYNALISACESFFEHLVQVRQSSLYFQSSMRSSAPSPTVASLTSYRRDAVATILLNLYILACALRAGQPVPKYLPNAAAARQKLLDRMEIVEAEAAAKGRADDLTKLKSAETTQSGHSVQVAMERGQRRWADVYEYAFSGALTDIVQEVQEMQRFTIEIFGEVKWE